MQHMSTCHMFFSIHVCESIHWCVFMCNCICVLVCQSVCVCVCARMRVRVCSLCVFVYVTMCECAFL